MYPQLSYISEFKSLGLQTRLSADKNTDSYIDFLELILFKPVQKHSSTDVTVKSSVWYQMCSSTKITSTYPLFLHLSSCLGELKKQKLQFHMSYFEREHQSESRKCIFLLRILTLHNCRM